MQNQCDPADMEGVSRKVFWRSFLLESIWNYEKLQNIGFLYSLYPALDKLLPDSTAKENAVKRHLETVNTHPAMSPLLAGVTARLECEFDDSHIMVYRKRIMATLAAHGDRFFWGHLRPFASIVGVFAGFLTAIPLISAILFLLIYNVPQLTLRYLGFERGWTQGVQTVQLLKSWKLETAVIGLEAFSAFSLGCLAGTCILLSAKSANSQTTAVSHHLISILFMIPIMGLLARLRNRLSSTILVYVIGFVGISIYVLVYWIAVI